MAKLKYFTKRKRYSNLKINTFAKNLNATTNAEAKPNLRRVYYRKSN